MRTTTLLGALALLAVGCASHPAPTEQVASSLAAVRGAEEAGALQVPEAALHVKLAEEQIEQAQALMSEEKNERAANLAVRAFNDAELAIALARENQAKQRLEEFAQANRSAGGEQPMGEQPGATQPSDGTQSGSNLQSGSQATEPSTMGTTGTGTTGGVETQESSPKVQPSSLDTRPRSGQSADDE